MKHPRRNALIWSAIGILAIIIVTNLIFNPSAKSLANGISNDLTGSKPAPQSSTTPDSLQGDTNKQQQKKMENHPGQGIVKAESNSVEKVQTALPLGKLIANITTKDNKTVYLTFDDGPGPYTKAIAAILQKNHAHGSFFWIGKQVTDELGQFGHQMIEQGDIIGSHTMQHTALGKENAAAQKKDLTQTAEYIGKKINNKVVYFRPPYGSVNQDTKKLSKQLGQFLVFWEVDSLDWSLAHKPEKILSNIEKDKVKPGDIILMHERKQTAEMLPKVIDYLRNKGYNFAALPAMPASKTEKS
ncbi:polysaccharide deacetylase family protein [Aneurinibacillus sp. Ricciae_BoGa-3]|uniref:polysaccharide deacetylase family protein n=1 Tax=Aneurinibacillus sp. Ricciae_BoGa-3 TaxID=3022697 RepID=UPI00233FFF08|nr:polysaccharide deacetylase family protein [Aneurinibacillus sp. Ricciae_BoGa-3]WCK56521.1 polysaccharide deacetylase family protein [Aneurinibacillus sp. Ricciae_BoGa-3]